MMDKKILPIIALIIIIAIIVTTVFLLSSNTEDEPTVSLQPEPQPVLEPEPEPEPEPESQPEVEEPTIEIKEISLDDYLLKCISTGDDITLTTYFSTTGNFSATVGTMDGVEVSYRYYTKFGGFSSTLEGPWLDINTVSTIEDEVERTQNLMEFFGSLQNLSEFEEFIEGMPCSLVVDSPDLYKKPLEV